jgi:hypothetical protein
MISPMATARLIAERSVNEAIFSPRLRAANREQPEAARPERRR